MSAETALGSNLQREIYLDRRICTATPDKIEIHPARSIVFLPLTTLLLGLAAFPLIYFGGASLSLYMRFGLTMAALILVPISGLGLVYSIAGANIVITRAKQSLVVQQGYLGMGVGTEELVPFWKIDRMQVNELTPHDYRGHQDDFAQYEISLLKLSGRELSIGLVTVPRAAAEDGLTRARDVADLIASMTGSEVRVTLATDASEVSAESNP